jgi:hypothetical protein
MPDSLLRWKATVEPSGVLVYHGSRGEGRPAYGIIMKPRGVAELYELAYVVVESGESFGKEEHVGDYRTPMIAKKVAQEREYARRDRSLAFPRDFCGRLV